MTSNGELYAPKRFKEIVKECWYISDNIHTSYNEVLDLSVTERTYLIQFIQEKIANTNKALEATKQQNSKR